VPETTTIQIKVTTWQALNSRKLPDDSFDDVIQKLLQDAEDSEPSKDHETTATIEPAESNAKEIQLPDDVPNRIDETEARATIRAAVQFIQENNGATKRELVENVMPDHPLGYELPELAEGERFRGAWYRRVVKPGLSKSAVIKKPKPSESTWRYVG
jgi:predicted CopG family antitoxin